MRKFITVSRPALVLAALTAFPALAQGNQDMLKPSQVPYEGESSAPHNDSAFFLGAGASFGQAMSTDGGSGGLAYLFHFEPGYQFSRGSWNRFELSGDFFAGKLVARNPNSSSLAGKIETQVGLGALAKVGYGYSLGGKMTGMMKAGVGPVLARIKGEGGVKTDGTVSGLAGQIGWEMVAPATDSLDLTGGISLTHMAFDIGDVKLGNGTKGSVDRSLNMNVPEAHIGLRLRL